MGNRKHKAKRSLASLPKGLPQRKRARADGPSFAGGVMGVNPFEIARSAGSGRAKHHVHNRRAPGQQSDVARRASASGAAPRSALARSLARRKESLRAHLEGKKKSNSFVDRRIGEAGGTMTEDEKVLARIVRERARRSKKAARFALDDDDIGDDHGVGQFDLTHKGRAIDASYAGGGRDDVILSSDDEDEGLGNLDRADTELHFGGGSFESSRRGGPSNPYGPSGGDRLGSDDLGEAYRSRKDELDEMIRRKKELKAERAARKEEQVVTFDKMDESFKELASLLQFRDKEKDKRDQMERKKAGRLTKDEEEMNDWDKEMKGYLFERKVKATDRTKTPEEIAKENADRLHELETKRLARMSGNFDDDDLSDVSSDEDGGGGKGKGRRHRRHGSGAQSKVSAAAGRDNPEALSDSEDEGDSADHLEVRFTADGLVYVDKDGNVVKKFGDGEGGSEVDGHASDKGDSSEDEESDVGDMDAAGPRYDGDNQDDDGEGNECKHVDAKHSSSVILPIGTKVQGNYHAEEQFEGRAAWYDGVVAAVHKDEESGTVKYDINYDDGDYEEGMKPEHVRPVQQNKDEANGEAAQQEEEGKLKKKKTKAKEKARQDMPYVFEVPTTLEALHDLIAEHASTGKDASLIIQRIHKTNSVRLNRNNKEKMQNFYDVLLRRFVAVGDAIGSSGDGGPELGRRAQLDALTRTLYDMAQDSPECAGAVWGRRIGILQKALAKRLRDAEFVRDKTVDGENNFSAWPSTGTFLLLRALGHIFPVTDLRHVVVTPALILLGQTLAQTPIRSVSDVAMGILCAGLMIEYTRSAQRLPPESLAFLAGTIRLFAEESVSASWSSPIPSLEVSVASGSLPSMRTAAAEFSDHSSVALLSLERKFYETPEAPVALLCAALHLVEMSVQSMQGGCEGAEREIFYEIAQSLILLSPKRKTSPLPALLTTKIAAAIENLSKVCQMSKPRTPLCRRAGPSVSQRSIKSLAPRLEDPSRYSMSKDKGKKSQQQSILDRNRREYKREQKAVRRELKLDGAFVENERRKEKEKRDRREKEKRNKNFSWLESEQASMNQQVRQGGGLLSGGGMGAARAKARSGKLGIKKGGKF